MLEKHEDQGSDEGTGSAEPLGGYLLDGKPSSGRLRDLAVENQGNPD